MKKNLVLYEIIGVLAIFTVVYFVSINKISYAFSYNKTDALYDMKMTVISKSAEVYATNDKDLFKEKDTIYVTVGELIEKGYLVADKEEKLMNPKSEVKDLNDLKIRIKKAKDSFEIKILK